MAIAPGSERPWSEARKLVDHSRPSLGGRDENAFSCILGSWRGTSRPGIPAMARQRTGNPPAKGWQKIGALPAWHAVVWAGSPLRSGSLRSPPLRCVPAQTGHGALVPFTTSVPIIILTNFRKEAVSSILAQRVRPPKGHNHPRKGQQAPQKRAKAPPIGHHFEIKNRGRTCGSGRGFLLRAPAATAPPGRGQCGNNRTERSCGCGCSA